MYVESGSLSYCVLRRGMAEYTNVRRMDGTFAEYPDDLRQLTLRYMEFKEVWDSKPESLRDTDYERYWELQKTLLQHNKNDISFMYGWLNQ